jgi:hypothetical protein
MAFAYGKLTEITTLPNSAGAVLTNAASTTTYIRGIMLHNGNTTAETVILYKVPNSTGSVGTAATANEIYKEIMAPAATTFLEFPTPGMIMTDTNDTIQGTTTTASKVTIQFTGATE